MTPEALTDSWLSSVSAHRRRVSARSRIGDGLVGMNIRLELDSDGSVPALDDRQAAFARSHEPGDRHRTAQLRA
jgi:hypothetical protein